MKSSAEILGTQETAPVVATVETIHNGIIEATVATVATGENNALHSTITTGHAQNVKILTLPSARRATDVKHPVLVAVEVPVTTAVVQTDDHNEMVDVTSNVAETTGKKSTTITTGHAENATTRISHSDKPATDVKHLALAAVEVDLAEAEVETDAAAAEAVMVAVMVAVDTVEETEVETDAAAAGTVVITIAVHRAPTQIFAMQRANAQDTLTTGDQTTFNRGSPTDTTIDWRLTT